MFDNLSDRLSQSLRQITGKARLTEDNIAEALRDVRMALLEADVALSVVKDFVDQVRNKAVGQKVTAALNPGEVFIKIVVRTQSNMRRRIEAIEASAMALKMAMVLFMLK